MTDIADISVHELAQLLDGPTKPLLFDCREPTEWQYCRIAGAVHIPMHDVGMRVSELDVSRDVVVYCHHGIRSKAVVEYLQRSGFERVANLAGGIDAWSLLVDPSVPRY